MHTRQSGVSLGGLLVGVVIFCLLGLATLKLAPSYMEYGRIKNAIVAIVQQKPATVADVRRLFDARSTIDDISSVKPQDLEITKEGNDIVISFAYRKEISLGANVGLYIDFAASSKDQ